MTRSNVPTLPPSHDRATTAQLRHLHALGKQRGLSHDDLRGVCGVTSLKELDSSAASRAIDRLLEDRPQGRRRPHPYQRGRRKFEEGEVRAGDDATNRQRREMFRLFDVLGWPLPTRQGWLKQRHGVEYADVARGLHTLKHPRGDLRQGHINRREASLAIRELGKAADKEGTKGSRGQGSQGADRSSLDPSTPRPLESSTRTEEIPF